MGTVTQLPRRPGHDPLVSKRQLAQVAGYSRRWVELRMKEGLPFTRLQNGETRFRLYEALEWVERRRAAR